MSYKLDVLRVLEWAALAALGGAVRYIAERMKSTAPFNRKRELFLLLGNCLISGFSGLIGALLVSTVTQEHTYQLIAAGMSGYAGTQGIEKLWNNMLSRLKL